MTLQELITDLKAAGANENTVRLAMNCYELGRVNEREDCAQLCNDMDDEQYGTPIRALFCADAIRARGKQ